MISEELMSIAWHSKIIVELFYVTRWVKRNGINFWKYWNISPLDIVQKSLWISSHFDKIQIFFLSDFLGAFVPKYQNICLKIFKIIYYIKILTSSKFFLSKFGNIKTLEHRKLYMKTCYNSESLWVLAIFLLWVFEPKCFVIQIKIFPTDQNVSISPNFIQPISIAFKSLSRFSYISLTS